MLPVVVSCTGNFSDGSKSLARKNSLYNNSRVEAWPLDFLRVFQWNCRRSEQKIFYSKFGLLVENQKCPPGLLGSKHVRALYSKNCLINQSILQLLSYHISITIIAILSVSQVIISKTKPYKSQLANQPIANINYKSNT